MFQYGRGFCHLKYPVFFLCAELNESCVHIIAEAQASSRLVVLVFGLGVGREGTALGGAEETGSWVGLPVAARSGEPQRGL